MGGTASKSIAKKNIVELAPAAKDLTKGHNLKGTLKVFLTTRKFREINEGILTRPVSELYPAWKKAVYDFLSLRTDYETRHRSGIGFFKKLGEAFFGAYAVQSATELWSPSLIPLEIAEIHSEEARHRYAMICKSKDIVIAYRNLPFPLRSDYVALDWGLLNLSSHQSKNEAHMNSHFKPLFSALLAAAGKGYNKFDAQMRKIESGNSEVQQTLLTTAKEPFFNMIHLDAAYKALMAGLPATEKEIFSDCVRLNEQFSIMNDLHGGFAMFNADLANKAIKSVMRYTDDSGRKEVIAAGWCWRQIGVLYRLMEEGRLKR